MDQENQNLHPSQAMGFGSTKSYTVGFLFSLLLTLAAYFIIDKDWLKGDMAVFAIVTLGVIQALFQLVFFLNLGRDSKPHWNLLVFILMLIIVAILVLGTIWIMYNLNYQLMPQ